VTAAEPRLEVARNARLRWDKIEARHVLLSPERGLALNETATEVVRLCDGTRTAGEIAAACVAKYGPATEGERKGIDRDVRKWLAELVFRGLVVEQRGG